MVAGVPGPSMAARRNFVNHVGLLPIALAAAKGPICICKSIMFFGSPALLLLLTGSLLLSMVWRVRTPTGIGIALSVLSEQRRGGAAVPDDSARLPATSPARNTNGH